MKTITRKFVREVWIPALLSGAYQQGEGRLRSSDNGFCCLGVAADKIDQTAWKKVPGYLWNGYHGFLPPYYMKSGVADKLTAMNDRGYSFSLIAEWLDHNITEFPE
jgi:hypothetical protein